MDDDSKYSMDQSQILTMEDLYRIEQNIINLQHEGHLKSQRIRQVKSLQTSIKRSNPNESFKPEINKKSQALSRTVNDLLKWHQQVEQKRRYIKDKELQTLHDSANQTRKDFRKNPSNQNVFQRLYSVHLIKQQTQMQTTSTKKDFYQSSSPNRTISKSDRKEQQPKSTQIPIPTVNQNSQNIFQDSNLPTQRVVSQLQEQSPTQTPVQKERYVQADWKPCLPNFLYFAQPQNLTHSKASSNPSTVNQLFAAQLQQQNFAQNIESPSCQQDSQLKGSRSNSKKIPLSNRQAEQMVSRLHQWQQNKMIRLQQQQVLSNQNELNECTFQPKILKREQGFESNTIQIQSENKNYSEIFTKKISRINEY